jgi:hypothetical protein
VVVVHDAKAGGGCVPKASGSGACVISFGETCERLIIGGDFFYGPDDKQSACRKIERKKKEKKLSCGMFCFGQKDVIRQVAYSTDCCLLLST